MKTFQKLLGDEAGFIVSAELVLVATIAVLSMVVGMSEVSSAVNQEMEDVGSAVGSVQQSFYYSGIQSRGKGALYGRANAHSGGNRQNRVRHCPCEETA